MPKHVFSCCVAVSAVFCHYIFSSSLAFTLCAGVIVRLLGVSIKEKHCFVSQNTSYCTFNKSKSLICVVLTGCGVPWTLGLTPRLPLSLLVSIHGSCYVVAYGPEKDYCVGY